MRVPIDCGESRLPAGSSFDNHDVLEGAPIQFSVLLFASVGAFRESPAIFESKHALDDAFENSRFSPCHH